MILFREKHNALIFSKRKKKNQQQNKTQWEKLLWKLNLKNGNEKHNDNYNNYSHLDIYMFPYSPHFWNRNFLSYVECQRSLNNYFIK